MAKHTVRQASNGSTRLQMDLFKASAFALLLLTSFPVTLSLQSSTAMPPLIRSQSRYYDNDTTSLHCIASGDPSPSYQWFRDGQEIDNEGHETLSLDDKTGTYHCLATNRWGTDKSDYIPYKEPDSCSKDDPRIHTRVEHITVRYGDDVTLPCDHLTCSSPPDVGWTVKTGRIRPWPSVQEDEARLVQTSDGSLYLVNVTSNAIYQCKAYDVQTMTAYRGKQFKVTIDNSRPRNSNCLTLQNDNLSVVRGDSKKLDCLCPGSVKWTLPDGTDVARHVIDISDVIKKSPRRSAQTFTCKTADGRTTLKRVMVTIEERPQIVKDKVLQDQLGVPCDQTADFRCLANGTNLNIQWFYNGKLIKGKIADFKHQIENHEVLKLYEFKKREDGSLPSGVIQCNISNSHGYLLMSARLTVADAPSQTIGSPTEEIVTDTTSYSGSSTTLSTQHVTQSRDIIPSREPTLSSRYPGASSERSSPIVAIPESSARLVETTTPSFPQSTPQNAAFNLTIWQIVAIATIPVFCLTCGICIAVCIMRMAWCGSGRSNAIVSDMRYVPSNQSDAHSMSRVEIPMEAKVLLDKPYHYKGPPSIPHSDSGLPDSEHDSVKQQMMARYLMESRRYVERRKYSNAMSVASSQGFAPSYSAAPLPRVASVAQSCPTSMEQIYHRVQTTV